MNKQKVKAWIKLVVTVLIALQIVLIIVKNSDNRADVWLFFGVTLTQVPVLWLLVATSAASIGGFLLVRGLYRTFGEIRRPKEIRK